MKFTCQKNIGFLCLPSYKVLHLYFFSITTVFSPKTQLCLQTNTEIIPVGLLGHFLDQSSGYRGFI